MRWILRLTQMKSETSDDTFADLVSVFYTESVTAG